METGCAHNTYMESEGKLNLLATFVLHPTAYAHVASAWAANVQAQGMHSEHGDEGENEQLTVHALGPKKAEEEGEWQHLRWQGQAQANPVTHSQLTQNASEARGLSRANSQGHQRRKGVWGCLMLQVLAQSCLRKEKQVLNHAVPAALVNVQHL
eukprot:scaffold221983_cov25-Tisochrysis_lutea.AAC.2